MSDSVFDIAIVGSGPSALSAAQRLAKYDLRIVIIEGGNENQNRKLEKEAFRAHRKTPYNHPDAHLYRRRMLGGASSVWGGRCIPFDPIDFEDITPRKGWPISIDDVAPYRAEALSFLEAGEDNFDDTAFDYPSFSMPSAIETKYIERFSKPTNVWKRYRSLLKDLGVTILSDTLVRSLKFDPRNERITEISTFDIIRESASTITAKIVILACGGIETPRLLLASKSESQPRGLGNNNDLVGRYYMTHLLCDIGRMSFDRRHDYRELDYSITRDGIYARRIFKVSSEIRRSKGLPSVIFRPNIPPIWDPAHESGVLSAMHIAKSILPREYSQRLNSQGRSGMSNPVSQYLGHGLNVITQPISIFKFANKWLGGRVLSDRKIPSVFLQSKDHTYAVEFNSEQFPDPLSRISLSDHSDKFGMPVINLDWRVGSESLAGLCRTLEFISAMSPAVGLGTFSYDPDLVVGAISAQGGHHIGTTRMAKSPEEGVVDENCKVYGVDNLYIAGPSVFTTSSSANPTLMGVMLSLRMADHIIQKDFDQ